MLEFSYMGTRVKQICDNLNLRIVQRFLEAAGVNKRHLSCLFLNPKP